jgi:hypothetical protein
VKDLIALKSHSESTEGEETAHRVRKSLEEEELLVR